MRLIYITMMATSTQATTVDKAQLEGSGTTISDTFGRAYGKLSDSSPTDFWKLSWMPIEMSYPVV